MSRDATLTFDTFVVAPATEVAYAASVRVAREPGRSVNPLVLVGPTGVGKTHLLRAIGNSAKAAGHRPVLYRTASRFGREILTALAQRKRSMLRSLYRQAALVLLDEVRFSDWPGWLRDELFLLLHARVHEGQQIVLASPLPLSRTPELAGWLARWSDQSSVVEIAPPETTDLIAIACALAARLNLALSRSVAAQLVRHLPAELRQGKEVHRRLLNLKRLASGAEGAITQELLRAWDEEMLR